MLRSDSFKNVEYVPLTVLDFKMSNTFHNDTIHSSKMSKTVHSMFFKIGFPQISKMSRSEFVRRVLGSKAKISKMSRREFVRRVLGSKAKISEFVRRVLGRKMRIG
jgi:hypothetical protein